MILEQLKEIRKQIVDLRDEMRVRFDRIEKRLNTMYLGLLDRLAEMDFDLGQIEGNVDELQVALYDLHAELQRLATDVHAFLEAANRRDLVEAINGSLGFRERTGEDLSLEDFRAAENQFFSWGNDHAKDVLQAGPDARDFTDDDLLGEVTALAAGHQRQLPARVPGRAARAPPAVRGPAGQPLRLDRRRRGVRAAARGVAGPDGVAGPGGGADRGRRGARQQPVRDRRLRRCSPALAEHYLASLATLQAAIAAFEGEFRVDEDVRLRGIDLLGGVDQVPAAAPAGRGFDRAPALRRPGVRRLPRHGAGAAEHRRASTTPRCGR